MCTCQLQLLKDLKSAMHEPDVLRGGAIDGSMVDKVIAEKEEASKEAAKFREDLSDLQEKLSRYEESDEHVQALQEEIMSLKAEREEAVKQAASSNANYQSYRMKISS